MELNARWPVPSNWVQADIMTRIIDPRAALLLDLDGTLIDIAPTPGAVVVPAGLAAALRRARAGLGDALAIVTGRPIEQVDALLPGVPFAVAGEHGGAIRFAPDGPVERMDLPSAPPAMRARAARIAAAHPGAMLEHKEHGLVLHFRAVPDSGLALRDAAEALIAGDPRFVVIGARMAWEIKPRGADKGTAVAALMARAPFAGRRPIFVGDDVTDEDGMRVARALGGEGRRVGEALADPQAVREWLANGFAA